MNDPRQTAHLTKGYGEKKNDTVHAVTMFFNTESSDNDRYFLRLYDQPVTRSLLSHDERILLSENLYRLMMPITQDSVISTGDVKEIHSMRYVEKSDKS